jgi:hypothetical protein
MDLENKLKGLPHIYYFNLDNRIDRRVWMESQFKYWGIENYTRISGSKYLASKCNEWKHLIDGDFYGWGKNPAVTANAITHIEFLHWWIENTNEEYMILMEDDYDLSLISYWHFDWEYLMNNIPYDWDCIQLGYESVSFIYFFLRPKPAFGTFFGPCMINRRYAKKLVDLHYNREQKKFLISKKNNNQLYMYEGGLSSTVDYFICENGRTYCIPLITVNNNLSSFETKKINITPHHVASRKLYFYWWKNERDKFTLSDFFTYNKGNDKLMTKKIKL